MRGMLIWCVGFGAWCVGFGVWCVGFGGVECGFWRIEINNKRIKNAKWGFSCGNGPFADFLFDSRHEIIIFGLAVTPAFTNRRKIRLRS